MIGMFPTSVQGMAGPLVSQLPITPFNMVCTNVPGPQFPLYLLGHKMLHCYPYVPVGGEMAVNCAILSYNGTVYFGFSGDVHAAPDLRRLEKLLTGEFHGTAARGWNQRRCRRSKYVGNGRWSRQPCRLRPCPRPFQLRLAFRRLSRNKNQNPRQPMKRSKLSHSPLSRRARRFRGVDRGRYHHPR